MNDIYRCLHCGNIGPAFISEGYEFRDEMYDRPPTREAVEVLICADCGSSHIEECVLCDTCGKKPAAKHFDDCEECLEKLEAEQDENVERIKELSAELAWDRWIEREAGLIEGDEYLP